jgi:hypothetical protein
MSFATWSQGGVETKRTHNSEQIQPGQIEWAIVNTVLSYPLPTGESSLGRWQASDAVCGLGSGELDALPLRQAPSSAKTESTTRTGSYLPAFSKSILFDRLPFEFYHSLLNDLLYEHCSALLPRLVSLVSPAPGPIYIMRLARDQPLVFSLLLLPSLSSAVIFDCTHVRVDGHSYDFSKLGGPRSVMMTKETPPTVKNTTYTIDLCRPLKKDDKMKSDDQCHTGARGKCFVLAHPLNNADSVCFNIVCSITTSYNSADDKLVVDEVIDIAGEYTTSAGSNRALSPKSTRLKKSDSETDGIRLELNGGRHPWDDKNGRKQQAVIEFICDKDRTGLEGLEGKEKEKTRGAADDETDKKTPNQSLIFKSYGPVDDVDVLRLDWLTKYACEDSGEKDGGDGDDGSHWGFFTWFIVM